LQKLEPRALSEIERLAKIQGAAEKSGALEIIEGETEKARHDVRKMREDTRQTLLALNIVLDEDDAERARRSASSRRRRSFLLILRTTDVPSRAKV
jgi:hypothetical protein